MNNGQENIAEEIHYLAKLADTECNEFQHLIRGTKVPYPAGVGDTTLLSFTVPQNSAWIVTFISLVSYPVYNDVDLVAAGGGDYRADDVDVSGTTKAWLAVNGKPIMPIVAVASEFCNRPVLFAFRDGDLVTFHAQRVVGTIPTTTTLQIGVHGYLTPESVFEKLSTFVTRLIVTFS